MHTILHRAFALLLTITISALFLGGCGSKPRMGSWDLVITPDASLNDGGRLPQVEVDLVGVKESELAQWNGYNVDTYFSGNDQFRANAQPYARTLTFSASDSAPKTVKIKDELWATWKARGVMHLVVLASSRTIKPGSGIDGRRLVIPLDSRAFKSSVQQIDVQIKSSGVQSPTPQEVIPAS
jgi:hypothetical protein